MISTVSYSQECDTLAKVRIENILLVQPDTLQFDLRIYRSSERWQRWANGTFEIDLVDTAGNLDYSALDIEYVSGTSQLNIQPITGQLPTSSYYMTPRVIDKRISITVVGPHNYNDAVIVPADTGLLIGRYRVSSKFGEFLPSILTWYQPQFYYQACAYKIETDSVVPPDIHWFNANDNLEMDDDCMTSTVLYDSDHAPDSEVILEFFRAVYVGQRKVSLQFKTLKEYMCKGFILRRGFVPLDRRDTTKVVYDHHVAAFDDGKPGSEVLLGLGSSIIGKYYEYNFDTIPYRGEEYCYNLYYKDFFDREYYLATACVKIPHSVIVFAQANPNPMQWSTKLRYILDDDVILECHVYDILGKKLTTLIDKTETEKGKIGTHEVVFEAPRSEYASQGLYEAIFLAHPVDDPGVDISRAVVKIQVIR